MNPLSEPTTIMVVATQVQLRTMASYATVRDAVLATRPSPDTEAPRGLHDGVDHMEDWVDRAVKRIERGEIGKGPGR